MGEKTATPEDLERAIDELVDVATGQHTWDTPTGRNYRLVIEAARAHLATMIGVPDTARPDRVVLGGVRESGEYVGVAG